MAEDNTYRLPHHVVNQLTADFSLPSAEMEKVEDAFLLSANFNYPNANTEKNWQKIANQISNPAIVVKQTPTFRLQYWWSAAAVVVLSLGFLLWQYTKPTAIETFTKTYNTTNTIKECVLDDGSKVVLNKYSEILVSISDKNRNVALKGEALFEVTHNNVPFMVQTKGGSVEVLGTIFNVKNRANLPLSIALVKGSIQFKTPSITLKLLPGECITQKNTQTYIKSYINQETASNWISDKLVFEDRILKDIIAELEAAYNVKFEYNEVLQNEKMTITFEHLTAQQAAELLSKTLNTSIKIK